MEGWLNDERVRRSFYPISNVDDLGSFDLLCKLLKDDKGLLKGKFSQILDNAEINDRFMLTQKDYSFRYKGYGSFVFKDKDGKLSEMDKVKSVVVLAQNTNISTFFQYINTLSLFKYDTTSIYLLYQVEDIKTAPLMDELQALHDCGMIGLECFEETNPDSNNMPIDLLRDYLYNQEEQLFLYSGSTGFCGQLKRRNK